MDGIMTCLYSYGPMLFQSVLERGRRGGREERKNAYRQCEGNKSHSQPLMGV